MTICWGKPTGTCGKPRFSCGKSSLTCGNKLPRAVTHLPQPKNNHSPQSCSIFHTLRLFLVSPRVNDMQPLCIVREGKIGGPTPTFTGLSSKWTMWDNPTDWTTRRFYGRVEGEVCLTAKGLQTDLQNCKANKLQQGRSLILVRQDIYLFNVCLVFFSGEPRFSR